MTRVKDDNSRRNFLIQAPYFQHWLQGAQEEPETEWVPLACGFQWKLLMQIQFKKSRRCILAAHTSRPLCTQECYTLKVNKCHNLFAPYHPPEDVTLWPSGPTLIWFWRYWEKDTLQLAYCMFLVTGQQRSMDSKKISSISQLNPKSRV